MKRIFLLIALAATLATCVQAKPKKKHLHKLCTMEVLTDGKDTAGLTCVDPPIKPPHWYKDKNWWFGEAIITAAIVADAHSTSRGVGMGLKEQNTFAFGSNPSNQRIALTSLGYFAFQSGLHAAAWHVTHHVPLADGSGYAEDHLGWRILGYTAIPATVAIINGHNAARNYALK